jgi:hypothetical protein
MDKLNSSSTQQYNAQRYGERKVEIYQPMDHVFRQTAKDVAKGSGRSKQLSSQVGRSCEKVH